MKQTPLGFAGGRECLWWGVTVTGAVFLENGGRGSQKRRRGRVSGVLGLQ